MAYWAILKLGHVPWGESRAEYAEGNRPRSRPPGPTFGMVGATLGRGGRWRCHALVGVVDRDGLVRRLVVCRGAGRGSFGERLTAVFACLRGRVVCSGPCESSMGAQWSPLSVSCTPGFVVFTAIPSTVSEVKSVSNQKSAGSSAWAAAA